MTGTPQKVAAAAMSPVTEFWQRQGDAARGGLAYAGQGVNRMQSGNIGDVALGAGEAALGTLGYLGSPVTAALTPLADAANSFVGQPVEKATGIPKEITTPVVTAFTPGLGIVPGKGRMTPTQKLAQPPQIPQAPKAAPVLESDQLRSIGSAAFKEAEDAGVMYTPGGLSRLWDKAVDTATQYGYDPALHPGMKPVLDRLQAAKEGNVTFTGLHTIKRVAQNAAMVRDNPSQRALAGQIIDEIDNLIEAPQKGDVLMGDAQGAASAYRRGKGAWAQMRKSETIDKALEDAAINTEKAGSGGNIDNNTRSAFAAILKDKRKLAGFNETERQLMRNIVRGGGPVTSKAQSLLRLIGKLSPQGNGLMLWGSIAGTAVGGPAIAAAPVAGFFSKIAADTMTKGNVGKLSREVRKVPQEQFRAPDNFLPPPRTKPPTIPPGNGVPMTSNLLSPGSNVIPLRGRTY